MLGPSPPRNHVVAACQSAAGRVTREGKRRLAITEKRWRDLAHRGIFGIARASVATKRSDPLIAANKLNRLIRVTRANDGAMISTIAGTSHEGKAKTRDRRRQMRGPNGLK